MARRRLRVTGFTRFLLFMLIVIPAAYFGVSYYKGEDGIQNLKDLLNIDSQKTEVPASTDATNSNLDCATLATENADLTKRLLEKSQQVTTLYKEIEDLKAEIASLKDGDSGGGE